jgi:TIR domain
VIISGLGEIVPARVGTMADIFVSYKSEDRERARLIAGALQEEGFDVWWDPALQAGEDYQEVIDNNLRQALVVVVLWSPLSVKSRWVRSEATVGDRYGALAPCMIEQCDLPTAFLLVQTVDLTRWRGDRNDPKWREYIDEVSAKREKRRALRESHSPAAAAPDQTAIESLFWQTIKDSTEPADFRSYIKRYPHGHFTDLAHNRLSTLTGSRTSVYAPPSRAVEAGPERPKRSAAPLIFGILVLAGLVGGGLFFFRGEVLPDVGSPVAAVAPARDAAPEALALAGKWGPSGLGCDYPLTIAVIDGQMAFGGDEPPATIEGVEPDGAVRVAAANGGTYFYALKEEKLTVRSPGGDSASFTKCAS